MTNIVDFIKFKETREDSNQLENNYLKFLTHVNQFLGIPSDMNKAFEVIYYNLRYLEGTINAISILSMLNRSIPRKDIEEGKIYLINWLNQIIEDIKNL
jgi:hypothetical protein